MLTSLQCSSMRKCSPSKNVPHPCVFALPCVLLSTCLASSECSPSTHALPHLYVLRGIYALPKKRVLPLSMLCLCNVFYHFSMLYPVPMFSLFIYSPSWGVLHIECSPALNVLPLFGAHLLALFSITLCSPSSGALLFGVLPGPDGL